MQQFNFIVLALIAIVSCQILSPTQIALLNAQKQNAPITRTIDSIFLTFPSQTDLHSIIFSADALALAKLIHIIQSKSEEVPCDALSVYSDQVIGMIRVVLENNILLVTQLEVIIGSAQKQIRRISKELSRLQEEKSNLRLPLLRVNLNQQILSLKLRYFAYDGQKKKLQPLEKEYSQKKNQIQNLLSSSTLLRDQITNDKLAITKIQAQIQIEGKNLEEAMSQISFHKQSIAKKQAQIADYNKLVLKNRSDLLIIEKEMKIVEDRVDEKKKAYLELKIKVERLRTDIALNFGKESEIIEEINKLQQRLLQQRNRLAYRQVQNLNYLINVLESALPSFVFQNNKIYNNCFAQNFFQLIDSEGGSTFSFKITRNKLVEYLGQNYQIQNYEIEKIPNQLNFYFSLVDPFGKLWQQQYGLSFLSSPLSSSSVIIDGDFTCLNPSAVEIGKGSIEKIHENKIVVSRKNTKQLIINIGACSRIESTDAIIRVGQSIFFKGVFSKNGEVNLYSATCI